MEEARERNNFIAVVLPLLLTKDTTEERVRYSTVHKFFEEIDKGVRFISSVAQKKVPEAP